MRDLLTRRLSQLREAIWGNRWWLRELQAYDSRLTEAEFWRRYTEGREHARHLWAGRPRLTEADQRAFYAESDYWLLRQMYYHRHSSFYWIECELPRRARFCEYGSGVGPVTAWLRRRHPQWAYTLVDVPSAMLDFARWRFPEAEILTPGLGDDLPLQGLYDGIACLDVLEHVPNPDVVVRHLLAHLKPGGALFVNFEHDPAASDENLEASQRKRAETIRYLNCVAVPVMPLAVAGDDVQRGVYLA